jgi:plastocyanin
MIMFSLKQKLLTAVAAPSLALLLAAGCTPQDGYPNITPNDTGLPPAASAVPIRPDVAIDNFTYTPSRITVPVGTTVTWVNHDDVPHTVTANDKGFGSKAMDTDDRFSHKFSAPGTYAYFCAVHKHMTGEVIVK